MGPKHTNKPYRKAKQKHNPFSDKLLKVMDPRNKPAALRHNETVHRRTKKEASPTAPTIGRRPQSPGHQSGIDQTLSDQHFGAKLHLKSQSPP